MTDRARPRVLVVEDHPLIREGVAAVLAGVCEIVGTVADGRAALAAVNALQPTVVVLDLSLPGMNGLEVATHLRDAGSNVRIVFLSVYDDEELTRAAIAAGGNAYVVKSRLQDLAMAVLETTNVER
jgi:DNA-binding NarL/FixJ family response regulator